MNSPTTARPSLTFVPPNTGEQSRLALGIYHVHPLVAGALDKWPATFEHVAGMGLTHVCLAPPFEPAAHGDIFVHATFERLHPLLEFDGPADRGIAEIVRQADAAGLKLMLDIAPGHVAVGSPLWHSYPDWFEPANNQRSADPRRIPERTDVAVPRFERTAIADNVSYEWVKMIRRFMALGVSGFRCLTLDRVPPSFWRTVLNNCKQALFLAWTPGLQHDLLRSLSACEFDLTCSSAAWEGGKAPSLFDELAILPRVGPVISSPEPSFLRRLAGLLPRDAEVSAAYRLALGIAAATGDGLFLPMGFEYAARRPFDRARASPADMEAARLAAPIDLARDIQAAVRSTLTLPPMRLMRPVSDVGSPVSAFLRASVFDIREAESATLVLINSDLSQSAETSVPLSPLPPSAGAALTADDLSLREPLRPGEVRLVACRRTEPVASPAPVLSRPWAESARIAIENIQPTVADGDFPAKTIIGRDVHITADLIADGHDILSASVLWRPADEPYWRRTQMRLVTNDKWEAVIRPDRIGLYQFVVEAWWDRWATFRHDLQAKLSAGQTVALELLEARELLEQVLPESTGNARLHLQKVLGSELDPDAVLHPDTESAMQEFDERPFTARSAVCLIRVDRPIAEFASWYELFPRSVTHDPRVHGTFRSVVERLPDIRAMGFDVLYFPPINPIGTVNRKGRNNSLRAEPGDVGSPYAIGSTDGGHDAIHPALGTLSDFKLLQREAYLNGLELALDFAVQCAPDHPWVSEHKDWFRWRPDGSMRYAENPPKKYEDIVNPDFYGTSSFPSVWTALRDVIRFWVDQGIRIFRVDNPHTKPLPFWKWMIADIQSSHPDVLFLSEAFTRPKLMYRLAKAGFTQSYTYFTWRNTKQEITDYLTEITSPPVADFFRPNFFVNTPDINPVFLQTSGRPGFLIRAVLAATLSGLWGVYSGFEICESAPLPGREEYLNSEKYEIRPRDYHADGNIVEEIAALNRIRRLHPALQTHLGVRFYPAYNDQIILFGKQRPGDDSMILVAVSLDPHNVQEAAIEAPLWDLDLPDDGAVAVTDLIHENNFTWHGKTQRIRIDPSELPFSIWRLSRVGVI